MKNSFFEKINDHYFGQAKHVSNCIAQEIISYADELSFEVGTDEFEIAIEMINRLREAIYWDGMFKNENEGHNVFYKDHNFREDFLSPWVNDHSSINIVEINKLISEYLSLKWFSSPTFEWFIINSYLRYCIQLNRNTIFYKSGLFKPISVAMASTNSALKYCFSSFLFKCMGLSFSYLFWCLMLKWMFNISWSLTAGVLSVWKILNFIYRHFRSKRQVIEPFAELIKLKNLVSGKTWSPSNVIDKVKSISNIYNIQELLPLFCKIMDRDKNIFNAKDYKKSSNTLSAI